MMRLLVLLLSFASPVYADVYIWVDDSGRTHITDALDAVPVERRQELISEGAALGELWDDVRGPLTAAVPPVEGEGRVSRMVRGAVEDLERGNTARAEEALGNVLRLEPGNPYAHFYLALLDQRGGRLDAAQQHLEAFLAGSGDSLEPWRASAQRRLAALADERRLAKPGAGDAPLQLLGFESPHFRVHYDARLGGGSAAYANAVARYREEAHEHVARHWGTSLREPVGVILYGKAAYIQAHAHRFSFQTVGFFDGRIHVVSSAHPAGELRSLLFHEYAHAVFREVTGGDRPFWLNEGLAELAESASRRTRPLQRTELAALRTRVETGEWIPLRRLVEGFAGLSDEQAEAAYLEAAVAAKWLDEHTEARARGQLLARLGAGEPVDAVLEALVGRGTDGVDAAARAAVLAEFPPTPQAGSGEAPPAASATPGSG